MTYSLLGRDPDTGEIGAAVQSKFPGVSSLILHGRADVGCLATQAFANPDHGDRGLALLEQGALPAEVIPILLRGDPSAAERQLALLPPQGPPAAHTGEVVLGWRGWAGASLGEEGVALGNSLAGPDVVQAMRAVFEETDGPLSTRLISGLRAGRDAGGELRGQQAAGLLVVKPGGGYGGRAGRHVDIAVYDHPDPIEELDRCYALHRLAYFPSDPDNLVPAEGPLAAELKALMARRGINGLSAGQAWTDGDIARFKRFMGEENYDNRLRDDGLVDREVVEDLRARYG